jgi:SPP1 family phage portal protein
MVIDGKLLENGITADILYKLIVRHEKKQVKYKKLLDYYEGRQDILKRQKTSAGVANNKLVCNHAKYVVDISQSYLIGNPVGYSAAEGYDIEPLKNVYLEQDIDSVDNDIVHAALIYGKSIEMIYANEAAQPKSVAFSPRNAFVVRDNSVDEPIILGVMYYRNYNIDGTVIGTTCQVADTENVYVYTNNTDSFQSMQLAATYPHYFGDVPFIEYQNDADCESDFEQIISLIDAYNLLQSDRVNDKEQFVDSFILLDHVDMTSETAQRLREEKILIAPDGGSAQYLSKTLDETQIETLKNSIKDDIHKFAMVPDLSDESFGGNLSGVSIKYKLMGFEQHTRNHERYITKGLKRRFTLYNNYLSIKGSMGEVPVHRIDVVFTRNMPVNDAETAQMIASLNGRITDETAISQLSFVKDAKEEAELAQKEKIENATQSILAQNQAFAGYNSRPEDENE